jgi:hypothetical protein
MKRVRKPKVAEGSGAAVVTEVVGEAGSEAAAAVEGAGRVFHARRNALLILLLNPPFMAQ